MKRRRGGGQSAYSVGPCTKAALGNVDTVDGEEANAVRRRYALLLAAEEPVPALELLMSLGDFEAADRVARVHFSAIVAGGDQVLQMLGSLQSKDSMRAPILHGLRGYLAVQQRVQPGRYLKELAESARAKLLSFDDPLERQDGHPGTGLPVDMQGLLMAAERVLGNWDEALFHGYNLEAKISEHDPHDLFGEGAPPHATHSALLLLYFQVAVTALLGGATPRWRGDALHARCGKRNTTKNVHGMGK